MKSKTDTAPSTGANPSTLTTAGQPAHLSPEQIDQAAQDVAGMISTARSLLLIGGSESVDGASYILDHAFQRLQREILPATMRATAPEAESASGVRNQCTCTIYPDFRALNRECPLHGDAAEARKRDGLREAAPTGNSVARSVLSLIYSTPRQYAGQAVREAVAIIDAEGTA